MTRVDIPAKTVTIQVGPSLADPPAVTEAREQAAKDSSNWNSLLRWHRRNRGPQWDYSTAMYHVDQGSKEYYAGVAKAEAAPKEDEERKASPERPQTGRSGLRASATPAQQPQGTSANTRTSATPSNSFTSQVDVANLPPMPQPQAHHSLPPMPQSTLHPQGHNQMPMSISPGMLQKSS